MHTYCTCAKTGHSRDPAPEPISLAHPSAAEIEREKGKDRETDINVYTLRFCHKNIKSLQTVVMKS